ncbi:MAG: RHS repeat domain-containing protein [Armatimonadota bacterium]|jgi:RHS repeat-associated protein
MPMSVTYATVHGRLVEENRGGVVTEYVPDTLGNVIMTTDESGTVTSTTTYWPFGEVRTQTGTNPSPWGFCGVWGYLTDAVSRMYVRARHYRADVSRWLTVDPLWPAESAYVYVGSRSVEHADWSGTSANVPPISTCKERGGKACFHCAYFVFSMRNRCPIEACKQANLVCGTSIACGPCGICPIPVRVLSCGDISGMESFGDFLRGIDSSVYKFDCSRACGGYKGADKLAHCFKGCITAWCAQVPLNLCTDSDPEDNEAEWIGYEIGSRLVGPLMASVVQSCLDRCADKTSRMSCY